MQLSYLTNLNNGGPLSDRWGFDNTQQIILVLSGFFLENFTPIKIHLFMLLTVETRYLHFVCIRNLIETQLRVLTEFEATASSYYSLKLETEGKALNAQQR